MGPKRSQLRVLYVEDDDRVAKTAVAYLESLGIEVHVMPRAELAVVDIHRVRPDVVLVDVYQSDAEAFELLRLLRQRSKAPIVLVHALEDLVGLVSNLRGDRISS